MADNKKLTEQEQIAADWQGFSKTLAYQRLIEYLETQKEIWTNIAAGPLEVGTMDENKYVNLDFEPEKYAYLLQRGVGCDIVKIYVEGYTQNVSTKQ